MCVYVRVCISMFVKQVCVCVCVCVCVWCVCVCVRARVCVHVDHGSAIGNKSLQVQPGRLVAAVFVAHLQLQRCVRGFLGAADRRACKMHVQTNTHSQRHWGILASVATQAVIGHLLSRLPLLTPNGGRQVSPARQFSPDRRAARTKLGFV